MLAKIVFFAACGAADIGKLSVLATNQYINACQADAGGFQMIPPSGPPTEAQTATMCKNPACVNLLKDILALNPPDCDLSFGGPALNVKTLATNFAPSCAKLDNPTPAPGPTSTPAPGVTTQAPAPGVTPAPGTPSVTPKPQC